MPGKLLGEVSVHVLLLCKASMFVVVRERVRVSQGHSGRGLLLLCPATQLDLCRTVIDYSTCSYRAVDSACMFLVTELLAVLLQTAPATTGIANMHIATKVNGKA